MFAEPNRPYGGIKDPFLNMNPTVMGTGASEELGLHLARPYLARVFRPNVPKSLSLLIDSQ